MNLALLVYHEVNQGWYTQLRGLPSSSPPGSRAHIRAVPHPPNHSSLRSVLRCSRHLFGAPGDAIRPRRPFVRNHCSTTTRQPQRVTFVRAREAGVAQRSIGVPRTASRANGRFSSPFSSSKSAGGGIQVGNN